MLVVEERDIRKTLKEVFGFGQFRGDQDVIIHNDKNLSTEEQ